MYVKIIFIILIIIILCYIVNNYILISNDISLLYDKFNRLNDDHIKLIKLVNTSKQNTKTYDCSKIFKESDDSECYVNQQTDLDLDKSVICYQSKSGDKQGDKQIILHDNQLTAINESPIKDDDKSSLALPLGSFVDAFLKKCLYNDDQDHIYYPEQKNDTDCITEQVIINESDNLSIKSTYVSSISNKKISDDKNEDNINYLDKSNEITSLSSNKSIVTNNKYDKLLADILKDDKSRKIKINNIISSIEKFKSTNNLKLINNI